MEALQKLVEDIDKRLKAIEYIIKGIQLPTSWRFELPVVMKQLRFPAIDVAADGDFLVVPTCAGIPTGTPKTAGAMVWDRTNFKLYCWTGSAWKKVVLS